MSIDALNWAIQQTVKPAGAKFTLVMLANRADAEGYCYPSQQRLALETSQSKRAVGVHLSALEKAGIIRRGHRYDQAGKRQTDGYWLIGFQPLVADSATSKTAGTSGRKRADYMQKTSPLVADSATKPTVTHSNPQFPAPQATARTRADAPARVKKPAEKPKAPPMSAGERNAFTDALIAFVGRVPEQADQVGWKKFRDFTNWAVGAGITAGQVGERAARYMLDWPDMERTPDALKRHWSRFAVDAPAPAPQRRGRGLSVAELANWEG